MQKLSHVQVREIVGLCSGATILIAVALVLSGGTTFLPQSSRLSLHTTQQTAATPFGTATYALPNFGGYLHMTGCYAGVWGGGGYNNGAGPPCQDSSYMYYQYMNFGNFGSPNRGQSGPPPSITLAEFSVRQTGTSPGKTGVLSYTASYVDYNNSIDLGPDTGGCPWGDTYDSSYGQCYNSNSGSYDGPPTYDCSMYATPAGYTDPASDGTDCVSYRIVPASTSVAYHGTTPTFTAGSPLTLEWSCQPYINFNYTYCTTEVFGSCWDSAENWIYTNYFQNAPTVTAVATGGATQGTAPTTAPASNTAYTLTCSGAAGTGKITIPIFVTGSVVPVPAVTITGNGTNPASVTVGQPVVIKATFAAGSGDTLTQTAINDNVGSLWCGTGTTCNNGMWTPQSGSSDTKTYTFNTTGLTPGPYLFTPSAQTTNFPWWDNYAQSLTVTVNPVPTCANGRGPVGGCTLCNRGFTLNNVTHTCDPTGVCGAHQVNYPFCSCDTLGGYTGPNGGPCTLTATCSDPHAVAPLFNTCVSGYVMQAGTCVLIPPALSLTVAQSRVQKGTPASLSWSVNNLSGDPTVECAIASNPPRVFSRVMPAGTTPNWSDGSNPVATGPIMSTTIFTLSCTGATPVSKTVTVVPSVIEI
jgi:hypothetical protein